MGMGEVESVKAQSWQDRIVGVNISIKYRSDKIDIFIRPMFSLNSSITISYQEMHEMWSKNCI